MHDLGDIAALSGCNHKVHVVWHQNVCVYPVPQAGAQEPDATYYDLATSVFSKEGLPVFDIHSAENPAYRSLRSIRVVGLGNPTYLANKLGSSG